MNFSAPTQEVIKSNQTRYVNGRNVKRSENLTQDKPALLILAADILMDLKLDGVNVEAPESDVDKQYADAAKEIREKCA